MIVGEASWFCRRIDDFDGLIPKLLLPTDTEICASSDKSALLPAARFGLVIHRLESECLLRRPSNTLKISQFDPVIR